MLERVRLVAGSHVHEFRSIPPPRSFLDQRHQRLLVL